MIAAFLARVIGLGRALPVRTWLIIAAGVAALALALWIYNAGGDAVREDVAAEGAAAQATAGKGRETASTERAIDTTTNAAKLEQWNHAAEQTPDTPPDERTLRRRCRQLRDAGTVGVPACRGFED